MSEGILTKDDVQHIGTYISKYKNALIVVVRIMYIVYRDIFLLFKTIRKRNVSLIKTLIIIKFLYCTDISFIGNHLTLNNLILQRLIQFFFVVYQPRKIFNTFSAFIHKWFNRVLRFLYSREFWDQIPIERHVRHVCRSDSRFEAYVVQHFLVHDRKLFDISYCLPLNVDAFYADFLHHHTKSAMLKMVPIYSM